MSDYLPFSEEEYHAMRDERFEVDDSPRERYLADCSECQFCGGLFYDLYDHFGSCRHEPDESGWTQAGREALANQAEPDSDFPADEYKSRTPWQKRLSVSDWSAIDPAEYPIDKWKGNFTGCAMYDDGGLVLDGFPDYPLIEEVSIPSLFSPEQHAYFVAKAAYDLHVAECRKFSDLLDAYPDMSETEERAAHLVYLGWHEQNGGDFFFRALLAAEDKLIDWGQSRIAGKGTLEQQKTIRDLYERTKIGGDRFSHKARVHVIDLTLRLV